MGFPRSRSPHPTSAHGQSEPPPRNSWNLPITSPTTLIAKICALEILVYLNEPRVFSVYEVNLDTKNRFRTFGGDRAPQHRLSPEAAPNQPSQVSPLPQGSRAAPILSTCPPGPLKLSPFDKPAGPSPFPRTGQITASSTFNLPLTPIIAPQIQAIAKFCSRDYPSIIPYD